MLTPRKDTLWPFWHSVLTTSTRTLELRCNGRKVRLRPQPCRVLAVLASRAGELVTREELREAIWAVGVHVRFDVGLS